MKLPRIVCVALLGAGLFLGSASAASAADSTGTDGSTCRPGVPQTAPETDRYFQGEPAFGPAELPTKPPVGPLLIGYERFGDLTEAEFVDTYRSGGNYIFPPSDGFLIENGQPVKYPKELRPGVRVDRFGFPGGSFLAPVDTPFAERSLPPQSLNTPDGTPLSNYHVYCVVRPFTVSAGPIAPWFGQPGLGVQYKLDLAYLPTAGANLSVTWLLANGYLVEEKPAYHHLLALGSTGGDRVGGPDGRLEDGPDGPGIFEESGSLDGPVVFDESGIFEEPGTVERSGDDVTGDDLDPADGPAWAAGEPVAGDDTAGPADRVPAGSVG
ncbi:TNT domain-containing protein [Micromonospora echinofusca]|uniref:TNT domain-containing protein n=1 Tax=Micromonospora echinofusca TaxID=47858 RepID=UPI001AD72865|nr:TNT domain-containing protein [Micromonospora echinofusca]